MAIREKLFAMGLRYRVQYRPRIKEFGRSTIDIAFPASKLAVFVDGCFWHGCPQHGTLPKANRDWWSEKLHANAIRDNFKTDVLQNEGWLVLRFWEHENIESVCNMIREVYAERRKAR